MAQNNDTDNPQRHITGAVVVYPPPSPPTLLDRILDVVEPLIYRFFYLNTVLLGMAIFYDLSQG